MPKNKKHVLIPPLKKLFRKQTNPNKEQEFHIIHRLPTVGDHTAIYPLPKAAITLFQGVESMATAFLDQVGADVENECYFDQTIDTLTDLAYEQLKEQRVVRQRAVLSIREELETSLREHQNYLRRVQAALDTLNEEDNPYEKKKV